MRILVLNWLDRENPQSGGAETHLHEIFGRLAKRGHDVTLLTSGFQEAPSPVELDGIEVHRTGGRYSFGLAAPLYHRRRLSEEEFDVVVEDLNKVPLFTPFWLDPPWALLVHHLFGLTAFQEASPPVAAATWLLERPVPRVYRDVPTVAVSESTAEDLARRGMPREGITVIPNGIDLERYRPDPDDRSFDDPTVLYLGRLKRYKRVDLILRAVDLLRKEGKELRLLVAGRGDREKALRALAGRLGLGESVRFLGFVSEERKRRLLRRAWIHVLTSTKEGWGITNLEAAACGTPTVASDTPGLRDSVRHGQTGLLVPHGDVEALARAVARLLDDGRERRRMGAEARRFAEGFSWERSAQRMEEFLRARVAAAPALP